MLFLWELAFFRRNLGEASAVAWLLFLLIVGFGLVNFFIARRIATSDTRRVDRLRKARARGGIS